MKHLLATILVAGLFSAAACFAAEPPEHLTAALDLERPFASGEHQLSTR